MKIIIPIIIFAITTASVKAVSEAQELNVIQKAAEANNCTGKLFLILRAIRKAENGQQGREFGVLSEVAQFQCNHWPEKSLLIQASRAARIIVDEHKIWKAKGEVSAGIRGFVCHLAKRYCPAETDPIGHKNWIKNVYAYYKKYDRRAK